MMQMLRDRGYKKADLDDLLTHLGEEYGVVREPEFLASLPQPFRKTAEKLAARMEPMTEE
jgi:hypothetical protein